MLQIRCAGCDAPGAAVCTTCRFALLGPRPQPGGHGVRAAVPFTGRARKVVLGLKYRNRRQVARHLAGLVVNAIVASGDHRGPRRGHLGAHQRGSPPRAWVRPGRTRRPARRPTTGCAVSTAAVTIWRSDAADRSVSHRAPARARVRRPSRHRRPSGPRGRRRRHHRGNAAGSGDGAPTRRSRRAPALRGCLHTCRRCGSGSPAADSDGASGAGGVTRLVGSQR